ncbi:MAG: phytanoyl-CoA dioxygenase family protein [Phycisphaerae bacterium]|nr:phytanoyl-CoA dioxygenase family protein [Phycisphaerae bacterium]OUX00700.1 MAG: phytanoyl-CoA dioxygenase family protein [Phycisphaeraceae bacterium TMED231]
MTFGASNRTDGIVSDFDRDGVVSVPDLLDEGTAARLLEWADEVVRETDGGMQHCEQTASGPVLARTEDFVDRHDGLRDLLTSGVVAETLAALFGEPAILFKEKINHKLPGGAGYAPHQDAPAYPYGLRHVTMLLAIDDAGPENGCLEFARGRHREGLLPADDAECLASSIADELAWEAFPAARGGAVFFDSFTPHRSGPNHSDRPRRALYVTYNAASEGDLRARYYAHKRRHLAEGRVSLIGHFQGRAIR